MSDFEPVKSHEQGGVRPVLILSHDKLNHGPAELIVVIPMTTRHRPEVDKSRVPVVPPTAA